MNNPCIITVAITGSVPKKSDTPAVPVTVSQQIESTQESFEAGASLVHVHVRDEFDGFVVCIHNRIFGSDCTKGFTLAIVTTWDMGNM